MYPIIDAKSGDNISKDVFIRNFISICSNHRNDNRALSFAFILYDFTNPHIFKILQDAPYWTALNTISDNLLTVFYVDCNLKYLAKKKEYFRPNRPQMSLLSIPDNNNDPSLLSLSILKHHFNIENEVKLPSVLFFQVSDSKISDYFFIPLKENEIEKSFLELKEIIQTAAEALKGISPDCYKNDNPIFVQVRDALDHRKQQIIMSKIKKIIPIASVLKLFF